MIPRHLRGEKSTIDEGRGLEDAGEALVDDRMVGHSEHTKVEWGA